MVPFRDEKLEEAKPFCNFNDMKNFYIYGFIALVIFAITTNM